LRVAHGAARGRLALVHLNLAERGSVVRKGILLFAAKLLGVRVLLHLHAAQIFTFYAGLSAPMRFLVRLMFRSADHCVVLGELWRRWVIETLAVAPGSVTVVDNGVPAAPEPRAPGIATGPFRLLFLGNLLERKGLADLLNALARPEARGVDFRLTVAGGGAVDRYREMATSLGLADCVDFTGWVDQTAARTLLSQSDALVLPSYDEGLPLVILEAMATGVPVICTPVGAIPEVFVDRRTALFVQPGDRSGLAATLVELSRDAELQRSLAAEGLALYRRRFTMEAFTDKISSLYEQITRPRARVDSGRAVERNGTGVAT
ncbi:MAG: glycosyltransferase family 4 protein, partial [Pseudomonadota bacterium]|nr:glycosyltransferase family 4 protein [Pseudomonadota bacterium]